MALAGLVSLLGTGCARKSAPDAETVSSGPRLSIEQEIADLISMRGENLGIADTTGLDTTWTKLAAVYEGRRNRPIWSRGERPEPRFTHVIEGIRGARDAGLDPGDYDLDHLRGLLRQVHKEHPMARELRPRTLARLDVLATYDYLRLMDHLRDGRVPRDALDPDWRLAPRGKKVKAQPATWIDRDPTEILPAREPRHPGYLRLKSALARTREIAERGGWPSIAAGPPLSLGARGPRVNALVRRLALTEGFTGPMADTVFDRRVEQAVGDLQTRLGLPRSGILGDATRAALNVPAQTRIRQMELNLERWRWLPETLGVRHVEINIPAYRLELIRDGQVARAMRVVVGKKKSPTPVFSDRITYLEINPTWTLPPSVVSKELAPALRRDPGYLEKNHMRVISIASSRRDTVPPDRVPWKLAATDSFPYLVIQDAGPENPLGRIKLMCPNEYDVYLHDTPQRSRFSVAVRDYSHGCVRVEEAVELADSLIAWAPQDTTRLDSLVVLGEWRRIRLKEPVPVHFMYWTAWADEQGRVYYRDDIYGLDERLDLSLRQRSVRDFVLNPGVEVSAFWAAAEARAREAMARVAAGRAGTQAR